MFKLLSLIADNHNALAVASLWAPVVAVSSMPYTVCVGMQLYSLSVFFSSSMVCICVSMHLMCTYILGRIEKESETID